MKHLIPSLALAALATTLTACGDATTDQTLPAGTAPNGDASSTDTTTTDTADTGTGYEDNNQATPPDTNNPPAVNDIPESPTVADPDTTAAEPEPETELTGERKSIPGMSYILPEGWTVGPPKSMRALTLFPTEFQGAELAISKWGGNVGGFPLNLNRWAGQTGVAVEKTQRTDYLQIEVSGSPTAYIPLVNKQTNKANLIFWVPRGDDPDRPTETWIFKLGCTAEQAIKLEDDFKAWAKSIQFD